MPVITNSNRHPFFRVIMALFVLAIVVSVGEIGARVAIPSYEKLHPPAGSGAYMPHVYRFDSRLGWLPKAGLEEPIPNPAAIIHVSQNSEGFRESERELSDRRPEWAVIGDSQTWGLNVEAADRFSNRLDSRFPNRRFRNYGVSGYGTAQELLLYQLHVRDHNPEGMLLLFGANDRANNRSASTRSGHARPHFVVRGDELVLENPVIPQLNRYGSTLPWYQPHLLDLLRYRVGLLRQFINEDPTHRLLAELARNVWADGHGFVVAIEEEDPDAVSFLRRLGVQVIELAPALAHANAQKPVEFSRELGRHWTPWGHEVVADTIASRDEDFDGDRSGFQLPSSLAPF